MFRWLVVSVVGILSICLNACGTGNYAKTAQSGELLKEKAEKANEPNGDGGGGSESGYGGGELNTESNPAEMGDMRLVLDKPFLSLAPRPDTQISFYAWNDGSAGILETNTSQLSLVTDHPNLEKASPAEIFWAVSTPGTEIPPLLREHHGDIANSEGRKSLSEVTRKMKQGWVRGASFSHRAPCSNDHFQEYYCLPRPGYTGGVCFADTNGNWSWTARPVRRYKARFCLDQGSVNDYLAYLEQAGDCNYFLSLHYIWGAPWVGNAWNAVTTLSWTWVAGSTTPSRSWTHRSYNGNAGDRYDWSAIHGPAASICSR